MLFLGWVQGKTCLRRRGIDKMRNTYCWAWVNAEVFVEHSLKKVMDRISVSCQVRDSVSFCRAMLCIVRPMPSCGVSVSVRLVCGLCQNE